MPEALDFSGAPAPLRVLMLATYFPKPRNPLMGNWALSQAQALRRNGADVLVVSLTAWVPTALALTRGALAYARCPHQYDWDGVPVLYPRWLHYPVGPARILNHRYPRLTTGIGWLTVRAELLKLARSFGPQVIYAHHTAVNGDIAMQLKRRIGIPFVVTDHDFGEIESCRSCPGRRAVFRDVARESSAMVAVSQRMEQEMRRQFPFARVFTVHNGAEPAPVAAFNNPRAAQFRAGSSGPKRTVFSCGAFYRRKGFPLLIDAFARIAAKHPQAELRIAGDGEERAEVEKRIRNHRLESRVTLLGFRPHSEVIREMARCDVFALIGWDEPFATVYLEALSAGKPVVCCSDGGITDVVKNGQHGFTVPPGDVDAAARALDQLLGKEELRLSFGRAAQQLFQSSLTWDRHARRMLDLFAAAVAEGAHPQTADAALAKAASPESLPTCRSF